MRGLLMIEPLYHQTVAGRKTQTRRSGGLELVNGCKATKTKPAIISNPDDWNKHAIGVGLNSPKESFDNLIELFEGREVKHHSPLMEVLFYNVKNGKMVTCKPRYKIGEVLYLKEPRYTTGSNPIPQYSFDLIGNNVRILNDKDTIKLNKLFMPAESARAFIKITGLRCERLLDISDADCITEGIEEHPRAIFAVHKYKNYTGDILPIKAKDSFLSLYKFANKVKEVDNIWVWVYEFTYLKDYTYEQSKRAI